MKLRGLEELRTDLRKREVFPEFVIDEIETAAAGESLRDWFAWHRRESPGATHGPASQQVVVFALTQSRFLFLNADDAPYRQQSCWSSSVTSVGLGCVAAVTGRSRRIAPEERKPDDAAVDVAYLVVSWNSDKKIKSGSYGYDPYSADMTANDASMRVSASDDGEESVLRLREFTATLADAVAKNG